MLMGCPAQHFMPVGDRHATAYRGSVMGQGLVGADVEDLRRLSAVMDSEAEKISNLQRQLSTMIQNGHYWRGNDAEQFRSQWNSDLHGRLAAAALCLKTNARTLRLNAEQQEQASLGLPGGGGGSGISGASEGKDPSGLPGFTMSPRTYGPITVQGSGTVGTEGTSEAHVSVGPDGISIDASGKVSSGARVTFTAEGERGPAKTTVTNETFAGWRADGKFDGKIPIGFGPAHLEANGEAFVGVENITTAKSDFFDGWINNTVTTRVMTGAEASAHITGQSPFLFSPGGEAFAGQKMTVGNETEIAGGLFGFGQGTEIRGGAWASAGESEINVNKTGDVTGAGASAGVGAELTASQYVEVLGQKLATSETVAAGAGEGHFFNASLDEDGLTLGVGAKITAELGLGAGVQVTLSPSAFVDSVTGFVDFLNK